MAGVGLVAVAPVLVVLTFVALGPLGQSPSSPTLRLIILADFVYVLLIAALIFQRVTKMVVARRHHSAGSRLHLRLTAVFAFLALIPSVLVAIFAVLSINVGLEGWFSDRVRNVLGTSLQAAQAYAQEHRAELIRDATGLALYLNQERQRNFFMQDGDIRQALGRVQAQVEYILSEAYVIDSSGDIRARGARSYEFDYERPSADEIQRAMMGEKVLVEDYKNNEFRILVRLSSFRDALLLATRDVDGEILALLDNTRETVALYQQLEAERGRILFEFGLLYLGFAVILVLAAIWMGLIFAEGLSRPIGRLVSASQQVGQGELNVRVREESGDDEISLLSKNFNIMTEKLHVQREELLARTNQIEERRRLFDSVLTSVTSGVVGLDPDGNVAFANRSALRLLDVNLDQQRHGLKHTIPEFTKIFDELVASGRSQVQQQVQVVRGGKHETLLVRMAPRQSDAGNLEGYVVAFDDVTDLVTAQRMAAWGDVARRIAHEIKNPLTPIQLSAERIKRKFRTQVGEQADSLEQMTDVIIRQTNDLRRIVDEFSKFARMPEPKCNQQDLVKLVRDAVVLQEAGQPNVKFTSNLPVTPVIASVDETMISQALTNLIKNAGEATESLLENPPGSYTPEIRVDLSCSGEFAQITISDNGIGLPEDRSKLFEPYVTTREKGTGLGLPIVKKIIEEHGGNLTLTDAKPFGADGHFGAMATITLPISVETEQQKTA